MFKNTSKTSKTSKTFKTSKTSKIKNCFKNFFNFKYILLFFTILFFTILFSAFLFKLKKERDTEEKWEWLDAISIRDNMIAKFGKPVNFTNNSCIWLNEEKGHKFILFDEEDKPLMLMFKLKNNSYVKKMNDNHIRYDVLGLSRTISYNRMKNIIQINCNRYDDGLVILIMIFKILDGESTLQEIKDTKMYRKLLDLETKKLEKKLNKILI